MVSPDLNAFDKYAGVSGFDETGTRCEGGIYQSGERKGEKGRTPVSLTKFLKVEHVLLEQDAAHAPDAAPGVLVKIIDGQDSYGEIVSRISGSQTGVWEIRPMDLVDRNLGHCQTKQHSQQHFELDENCFQTVSSINLHKAQLTRPEKVGRNRTPHIHTHTHTHVYRGTNHCKDASSC